MEWGNNVVGELGNGTVTSSDMPVAVCALGATPPCSAGNGNVLTGVKAVSGGDNHSLALLNNGEVRAWGYNGLGELGNGTTTNSHVPVAVSGLGGITAISAGGNHSLALLGNGTVMAWG